MTPILPVAEVFIDGEKVVFSGAPPRTLGELRRLLESVLGEQQRLVLRVAVDGADAGADGGNVMSDRALADIGKVEVESVPAAEALTRLLRATIEGMAAARARADAMAAEVLGAPWSQVEGRFGELAEALGRGLEGAAVAVQNGAGTVLETGAERLAGALGRWLDCVRQRDAAGVSLALDDEVIPALDQLTQQLRVCIDAKP